MGETMNLFNSRMLPEETICRAVGFSAHLSGSFISGRFTVIVDNLDLCTELPDGGQMPEDVVKRLTLDFEEELAQAIDGMTAGRRHVLTACGQDKPYETNHIVRSETLNVTPQKGIAVKRQLEWGEDPQAVLCSADEEVEG
jgi:hypothetical protein